ncbi:Ubiquitin domain-containing protein [Melia azedarach]|uniref:Ubiquitin domain-containing protein n=1 Tax=Melia azedarach TaxID=155640 RepID=A0ACC1YKQ9_MELAZ|nr:Ubiquitin domain-containing protein [Melia azedarach]
MSLVSFVIGGGAMVPEIELPTSATVLELKQMLGEVIEILVSRLTLTFCGTVLTDDQVVGEFHRGNFPAILFLQVEPLPGNPEFLIFVNPSADQNVPVGISVRETTTVEELMVKIEEECGVSAETFTLHYLGKAMDFNFPLSSYYISPGCEVEITLNPTDN